MTRVAVQMILLALVAGSTIPGIKPAQRTRSKRNRPPTIQSFTSSLAEIDYCPFDEGGSCSSSGTIVTLEVKAKDQDNEKLTYKYSVSAGAIAGDGSTVNWDLDKAPLGMQTATVEVTDQHGRKASSAAIVNVVMCGACDPPRPYLSVTCPAEVTQGEVAVFAANLGIDPDQKLTFLWSHSNGFRFPGQEGPTLRIKAAGLPGDLITATVRVLGLDPSLNRQASCESRIVTRTPSSSDK